MNSELTSFQLIENALRAAQLRQTVYANNVANIDTPGYKRQDVQFESVLNAVLSATPQAEMGQKYIPVSDAQSSNIPDWSTALSVQPSVVQDTNTVVDNNGNNVDIDAEMSRLAENQIRYNALIQDMKTRIDRLKNAINGG